MFVVLHLSPYMGLDQYFIFSYPNLFLKGMMLFHSKFTLLFNLLQSTLMQSWFGCNFWKSVCHLVHGEVFRGSKGLLELHVWDFLFWCLFQSDFDSNEGVWWTTFVLFLPCIVSYVFSSKREKLEICFIHFYEMLGDKSFR